jgi:Zn-dependent protease with chaperone function
MPGHSMKETPMLRTVLLAALATAATLAAQPVHAQFLGGGKPKLPDIRVLDTYDQAVLGAAIDTTPVNAGLATTSEYDDSALQEAGLNPANYRGTLALLQRYVNRIAELGPRKEVIPKVTLKLALMADASAPSRSEVVLTTGLLDALVKQVPDDKEFQSSLAFVLGHEYAHILYDHPGRFAQKEDSIKLTDALSTVFAYAVQFQGLASQISPELAQANSEATSLLAAATSLSPYVESELYRVTIAPYRRDEESLADFMSADLLRNFSNTNQEFAAIMNPQAGMQSLSIFAAYDNSIAGQVTSGLKRLGDEMEIAGKEIEGQAEILATSFDTSSFMANARASIVRGALKFIAGIFQRRFDKDKIHLHYSSDKRQDSISAYLQTFYAPITEAVSDEDAAAFDAFSGLPSAAEIGDTFSREYAPDKASQTAMLALLNNDLAGARAALDEVNPAKVKSAHFHAIDGTVWQRMGEFAKAEISYKRAIALPEADLQPHRDLAQVQIIQGKHTEALVSLDATAAKFGASTVIVDKIQVLVALERIEEAKVLAVTCETVGGKDLAKRCTAALPEEKEKKDGLVGLGTGLL